MPSDRGRRRRLRRISLLFLVLVAGAPPSAAPADFDSLVGQARSLESKEDFAGAVLLYEQALALRPEEYWATVQLAHDYARLGRFEDAHKAFARAKRIDPKQVQAYIEEGYASADEGGEAEAQKQWALLIAVDTASFVGYHHMGASLERQQRLTEAEPYLRASVERLKDDRHASRKDLLHSLIALAGVLWREGKLDQAEAVLREGVDASKGDPANMAQFEADLASVSGLRGRKRRAEKLLKGAAALCDPKDACFRTAHVNVLLSIAGYHLHAGHAKEAEAAADKAAALYEPFGDIPLLAFPFSIEQFATVAAVYRRLGRDVKAEEIYRRLIALRPSMPYNDVLVDAEVALAERCASTERRGEAEGLYSDAIRILEHRGEAAREAELCERAAALYELDGKAAEAAQARRRGARLRKSEKPTAPADRGSAPAAQP